MMMNWWLFHLLMTDDNKLLEDIDGIDNMNENVKDDTNNVKTEEVLIYNLTTKYGNVDDSDERNFQKKE